MTDDYFRYLCPECRRVTEYVTNPYYFHKCKKCGHETYQSHLIQAVDKRIIRGEIAKKRKEIKNLERISKEYPDCRKK
jgi:hypothetical protein